MSSNITYINSDAGLKPDGKAAYSYWIQHNGANIKSSGPILSNPKDSNEAEIIAILKALNRALDEPSMSDCSEIVVRSDSWMALMVFRTNQINGGRHAAEYAEIKKRVKCPIQWIHVKSHKECENAAEWINNWCDKELRKHY